MNLALFDLDHTLLPIDSDYTWCQFLIGIGVIEAEQYEARNQKFYDQYKAGTLDIHEFLGYQLRPLADNPRHTLDQWHERFMSERIEAHVTPSAVNLVKQHIDQGDDCILVTATNSFVTAPIARRFGIPHLIATDPEECNGQFTGGVAGIPSFREGKVTRTEQWLSQRNKRWADFDRVYFYSDSINDLPLLEKATDPVATNPDASLETIARERGWSILKLFE
jgi:HAD superfamily hydrolase (TIGR01490 family)